MSLKANKSDKSVGDGVKSIGTVKPSRVRQQSKGSTRKEDDISVNFKNNEEWKKYLAKLRETVDPSKELDDEVENLLGTYSETYFLSLLEEVCTLASHRGAKQVNVDDVTTLLKKKNISVDEKKVHSVDAVRRNQAFVHEVT